MILIFDCPVCGRENEIETKLEREFDYIEQGENKELECECLECENTLTLELSLEARE